MALWVVRCGGDSAFEQEAYEQKFIGIIEGEFPESSADCESCKFLAGLDDSY